ncbi:Glutathione gamma-glutamylcysteinyltransferase [Seminavis robusta]|uniref:glutathione gamma-glutamylcysteinyltransferase n=1 Tax=Seminavis robusta TaxID=568900 RepID=A0A9N8H792_9STRA|nr:Glutathione gamma-glutamylcysteinyltransferase [Seminavis robusta]|eukprot:Sro171_g075640.1 Glutathione gamma-glutamylcysteinyltransferase (436) ;mRNA; r:7570-8877
MSCSKAKALATPTTSSVPPRRTFYRRPLPDSCTALSSPQGQERFASAMANKGVKSFFVLMEQYTTQPEPAFCGMTTLVMVLNALAVDPRKPWKGPWRWYEETMLNCCLDLEEVKQTGITIQDFRCLAICQGLFVDTVYAAAAPQDGDDKNTSTTSSSVEDFRRAVQQACVGSTTPDELLVVSYSRKVLGQTGSGHFSPIAAYDAASDSVLVMDTARFKYGPHWVSVPLLWDAMKPVDPTTNRSRGYLVLRDFDQQHQTQEAAPILQPSLLFRSQRKQNPVRRQYKEFLAANATKEEVTLDQVIAFWTQDSSKPAFVWQMMEPQFTPLESDDATEQIKALISNVRACIRQLMDQVPHGAFPSACCKCRINYSRSLDMTPQEAIFIVYLASLSEERRREVVGLLPKENNENDDDARTQLLVEADLLRHAIDMSDDNQ